MRHIEQKMIDFIDGRLASNGMAQEAIKNKDARALFTEAAKACVGIREKTGNNDGPMVELIQETIGKAEHESWCMAFMQTCIAYAEVKTGKISPLVASETVLDVWDRTPKEMRVKTSPLPGAVIIWQHGKTIHGHTGLVLGVDEKTMHAVEGNTNAGSENPSAPVVREGGGVYYTVRSRFGTGDMHVLGFLIPFPKEA